MIDMKNILLLSVLLVALPSSAQYFPFQGNCTVGNTPALTSGLKSTNTLQASYPKCTVTVYATGTSNLATLYSNATGSILSNPFTASIDGSYLFFTAPGSYDITMSGGLNGGFPTPKTITSVSVSAPSSGGGVNPAQAFQIGNYASTGTIISGSQFYLDSSLTRPISKLPRVDVTHPSFAGGADRTGTLDSTAAIQAAIAYSNSQRVPVNGGSQSQQPDLYLPEGLYSVSGELRIPCNMHVKGDSRYTTNIIQTSPTANTFTVYDTGCGLNQFGSIEDLTVTGTHLTGGNAIELDEPIGFNLQNIDVVNFGGRGIQLNAAFGGERQKFNNITVQYTRWPFILASNNVNEITTVGLDIIEGGHSLDNANVGGVYGGSFCWDINCVNGAYPNTGLGNTGNIMTSIPTVVSATSNGSTATYVMSGGGSSGVSPIQAGQWFNMAGVTGNTALNGFFQATGVASNSPSAGQFSIAASNTSSGSGTTTSATFQVAILPATHCAVWDGNGVRHEFIGGSIKSLQMNCGVQEVHAEAMDWKEFYFEGFPFSGQPRVNSGFVEGGLLPMLHTTAAMPATGATVVPVNGVDAEWWPIETTTPSDLNGYCTGVAIMPADAIAGSTVQSVAFPSVTKGTVEYGACVGVSTDGAHVFSRGSNPQAWPAGSIMHYTAAADFGGSTVEDSHFNAVDGTSPTSPFIGYCQDAPPLAPFVYTVCAEMVDGYVPDGMLSNPPGSSAGVSFASTGLNLLRNSVYTNFNELSGEGYVKGNNFYQLKVDGGYGQLSSAGDPNLSTQQINNSTNNATPTPYIVSTLYGTGAYAHGEIEANGARSTAAGGGAGEIYNTGAYSATGPGTSGANAGTIPGTVTTTYPNGITANHEFTGGQMWADQPVSGNSSNRFMFMGTPGTAQGFEYDYYLNGGWNPGGVVNACGFQSATPNGVQIGCTENFVTYSQNLAQVSTGPGVAGWFTLTVRPTITCGQTDPQGGTGACSFTTVADGNTDGIVNETPFTLNQNLSYANTMWAKGAVGGELIEYGAKISGNIDGPCTSKPLTTTWQKMPPCLNPVPLFLNSPMIITEHNKAQTVYIAFPQTTFSPLGAYLPTTATGINSPTTVVNAAQILQGGVPVATGGTPVRAGTVNISAGTSLAVTFSTPMSAAPTACTLQNSAASGTTTFWPTSLSTTGFTANASVSTTATLYYNCVINNAN